MNLLIQDLCNLDFFKAHTKRVQAVTRVLRHATRVTRFLRKNIKRRIITPCETRWSSLFDAQLVLKSCRAELKFLASSTSDKDSEHYNVMDERTASIVQAPAFWQKLDLVLSLLKPCMEMLLKLQEDDACPSELHDLAHSLKGKVETAIQAAEANETAESTTSLLGSIDEIVGHRMAFICPSVAVLAKFLHPNRKGQDHAPTTDFLVDAVRAWHPSSEALE